MNEFTVSLRAGRRMVIRADRCAVRADGLIELVTDPTGEPQRTRRLISAGPSPRADRDGPG